MAVTAYFASKQLPPSVFTLFIPEHKNKLSNVSTNQTPNTKLNSPLNNDDKEWVPECITPCIHVIQSSAMGTSSLYITLYIDIRRQNLTSRVDPRIERVNVGPTPQTLNQR